MTDGIVVAKGRTLTKRHVGTGTFIVTERMRELINEVLDSGRISYGPLSKRFERDFAELHGCKYGILSNSGTSSLHVALQALKDVHGWGDWDEVIVPALTFVATINIVLHNRMKPVFVDIDPDTYGIDVALLREAVTERTRAVIPVHLFGQPCNMIGVEHVAHDHGLKIIEDSCETMFVRHHQQVVGSFGDIACFSMYNAHLLTTGVGGIATTDSPIYASKMRSLVNHGLDIDELYVDDNFSPRPATGRSFRFTHAGHSFRITELEAALGLAQLEDIDYMLAVRFRNARHITAKLTMLNEIKNAQLRLPVIALANEHAWMMYPIVMNKQTDELNKQTLTAYLNEWGIETRDMMPITNQPIFSEYLDPQDFPEANRINKAGFYVGCHQGLEPEDIEYMTTAFHRFYGM
jgi:perosamine synthetase